MDHGTVDRGIYGPLEFNGRPAEILGAAFQLKINLRHDSSNARTRARFPVMHRRSSAFLAGWYASGRPQRGRLHKSSAR